MKLYCTTCGAAVPAHDVNVQTMTAACRACGAIFQFTPDNLGPAKHKPLTISAPPGITERQLNGVYELILPLRLPRRATDSARSKLTSFSAVLIVGMALALAVPILSVGAYFFPLLLLLIAVSLLALYLAAALFWGSRRYRLNDQALHLSQTLMPWATRRVPRQHIIGFITHPTRMVNMRRVEAVLEDGSAVHLGRLPEPYAAYVRQELQQRVIGLPTPMGEAEDSAPSGAGALEVHLTDDGELLLRPPGEQRTR